MKSKVFLVPCKIGAAADFTSSWCQILAVQEVVILYHHNGNDVMYLSTKFQMQRRGAAFSKNLAMEGGPEFYNSHFIFLQFQIFTKSQSKRSKQRFLPIHVVAKKNLKKIKSLISTSTTVLFFYTLPEIVTKL